MATKSTKIVYWTTTLIFSTLMVLDGIGGLLHAEEGRIGLAHLGYPEYLMTIVGIAKILGVIAILQPFFQAIKEWAYSGFAVNFIGASLSHLFVGDTPSMFIAPLIVLAFMMVSYWYWKKMLNVR